MREKRGEHPWGDAGQLIALGVFLVVWAGDSFFLHASTFLSGYVPLPIRLAVFGLALVAALWLVRSGHVAVSEEQRPAQVIAGGVFRYVRHPLYLAALLGYLGLTALTLSLLSLALWGGIFIFYNYIASYEESLMEIKFGAEYRGYKEKTGKWIPILSSFLAKGQS
jgi:protein-S-isoprenylcysteine O-methyltransferase Ste14